MNEHVREAEKLARQIRGIFIFALICALAGVVLLLRQTF